ncbi:response regulator [Marinobacterium mangrovicola]|uniref:Response regulator receiver modulated metal dependent phosphohydrolase n=1 Tax=Marinobacterium mangrovicola TaxID=1476959 RepID=A0A4R1GN91_9GAMM|nr:two-component system response regulator [Marinobacterium mangrovicola]TCK08315.1 response regulator receiver modulated metal dependent phosphohydrolase [Marinobacterium mangrovicola]
MKTGTPRQCILVVDDEPANLRVLRQLLNDDYRLLFARDGESAIELTLKEQPDLVLLDVMMPGMTGYEVCSTLKSSPETKDIPVIFVTALKDSVDEARGFELGAVDFINKPLVPAVLQARVRTHLSLVQAETVTQSHRQLIERLGRAAEYKDNETGMHVMRMSHYARMIAIAAGYNEETSDVLLQVAPMHDIGKIGIPDHILLKPGRLTEEEFDEMKRHPLIGAEILGDSNARLIRMARTVALTHHEKWDGSGYPYGLSGSDIPIEGRIVAIADVLDALTSERPYKKAWSLDDALSHIREQSGKHFDPELVALLDGLEPGIREIAARWAD